MRRSSASTRIAVASADCPARACGAARISAHTTSVAGVDLVMTNSDRLRWGGSARRRQSVEIGERVLEHEQRVGFEAAEISFARVAAVRGEEVLLGARGAVRVAPHHHVGDATGYGVALDGPRELAGPPRGIAHGVLTRLG